VSRPVAEPSESELITYFDKFSNWGRWGPNDELGTLNLITPNKLRTALTLVTEGVSVSCARLLEFAPKVSAIEGPLPAIHFMQRSGENAPSEGQSNAYDWVGFTLHGLSITHLDAPSHVFWNGQMYNGQTAASVTTSTGAHRGAIDLARHGIVSRGILLDIPRLRGREWLTNDEAVTKSDLVAAEEAEGVAVEPGDVVLVRTGYPARRTQPAALEGSWTSERVTMTGMTAGCLPWLHDRMPAVIATDVGLDKYPPLYSRLRSPIHHVAIVAMGMWVIDACDLEELSRACSARGRWLFCLSAIPIRFESATGSPINPIAIF
jgi:kynurenine formamidase